MTRAIRDRSVLSSDNIHLVLAGLRYVHIATWEFAAEKTETYTDVYRDADNGIIMCHIRIPEYGVETLRFIYQPDFKVFTQFHNTLVRKEVRAAVQATRMTLRFKNMAPGRSNGSRGEEDIEEIISSP